MKSMLPSIDELVRMPSPCPGPIGIAYDGGRLWLGAPDTERIYAVDPACGAVTEEAVAPGSPYGMTAIGDELRVVVGDADDERSIARYVVGHGFKSTLVPCPQGTGAWLAYDGEFLFLVQRFHKRILELEPTGEVRRTIPVAREVTGMTIVDGCFYLITTESKHVDDYRLARFDARLSEPVETELAAIPFTARGLAFDGTRFWTNIRAENTVVGFARPG
ncbi:MAG: YncE family protein [Vulcanimicrobiaceae bacterium]